jgi:hypothetical protein
MYYVYPQIHLMRQGHTLTIRAIFLYCECGGVVKGTGHKAKRLMLHCINVVSLISAEVQHKIVSS